MAFTITNAIGAQPIGSADATAQFPVGSVVMAIDPVLGAGEFVYLKGAASTVEGSVVVYDTFANTSTLLAAGQRGPAAVAMGAIGATQFGFYQVSGTAKVKETGATAGANVYATATAGTAGVAVVAGDKLDGARFKTADAAGFAYAQLSRPSMNANG